MNNRNTEKNVNDIVVVFLLLTLNVFHTFFSVSIVDFEQVSICWVCYEKFPPEEELYTKLQCLRKCNEDLNPFHSTCLFLYPLKTSENLWFSDVFRGYRKRSVS